MDRVLAGGPVRPPARAGRARRAARVGVGLALAALLHPAGAAALPALEARVAPVRAAYPDLLVAAPESPERISGVDARAAARLVARAGAGAATAEDWAAIAVAYESLARLPGPVNAVEARRLLSEAVAAAVSSGDGATLDRVAALLEGYLEDPGREHEAFAKLLYGERLRCGASAQGRRDLLDRVARRLDAEIPGDRIRTDGTTADRFGLHASADLFRVAARGPLVAAVGSLGSVIVSRDGGERWEAPATGTDEPLFALALSDDGAIWAVGRSGVVIRSGDGGARFERRPTPFRRHLFGVRPLGPGRVLVAGDFGLVLRSDDDGARWSCVPREHDLIYLGARPAAEDTALVGEFGTLERLALPDLAARRGRLSGVPDDVPLADVGYTEDGRTGLAVGVAGTVLRSDDGGASWAPVATPLQADLYGVAASGRAAVLVGDGGAIAHSTDGGRSFAASAAPPIPAPLLGVAFASPERAYVVGPRGLVLVSDDGGASFRRIR